MNNKIETAVILAAGMGSRLRDLVDDKPKGFIECNKKTIIEHSIEKLQNAGIKKVIIVTGYLSHYYEKLAEKYSCLVIIKNTKFEKSGSLYSLFLAKDEIDNDFLLLESDLVYEQRAINELLYHPEKNVILLSGYTNAGDEVYVETIHNKLVNMSKNKNLLNTITGELVGISKISYTFFTEIKNWAKESFKNSLFLDYETDGFVKTIEKSPIFCHKVDDLIWCEIDNREHYDNAIKNIFPKLT